MKRLLTYLIAIFCFVIITVSSTFAAIQTDYHMGDRVRQSHIFEDFSEYQREMAAITFGKDADLISVMKQFRAKFIALREFDQQMVKRADQYAGKLALTQNDRMQIDLLLQELLPSVDTKLNFFNGQCVQIERQFGINPNTTPLKDEVLFELLNRLAGIYGAIIKLYDYREVLMVNLITLLDISDVNDPDANQLFGGNPIRFHQQRKDLEREVYKERIKIEHLDTLYLSQSLLVNGLLAQPAVQEELNHFESAFRFINNFSQDMLDDDKIGQLAFTQLKGLLKKRVGMLRRLSVQETFGDLPGLRSNFLLPSPKGGAHYAHPILSSWDQIRNELILLVNRKGQILTKIKSRLLERNQLVRTLIQSQHGDMNDDDIFFIQLAELEERIIGYFSKFWSRIQNGSSGNTASLGDAAWNQYHEGVVDTALILEMFLPIEIGILSETKALFTRLSVQRIDRARSGEWSRLPVLLRSIEEELTLLEALCEKEETVWRQFDHFLSQLMKGRVQMWEKIQTSLSSTSGVTPYPEDPFFNPLMRTIEARIDEARCNLTDLERIDKAIDGDPIIRILFGRMKYSGWRRNVLNAGFLHQVLYEMSNQETILNDTTTAGDPKQSMERRLASLVALIRALSLPWDISTESKGITLLFDIAGKQLSVENIARKGNTLKLIGNMFSHTSELALRTIEIYDFVMHPPFIGKSFWSNFKNRLSNQWDKKGSKWTYAIIAVGGVIGACVVGPVVLAGAGIGLAIQAAADLSVAGGHAHLDKLEQAGHRDTIMTIKNRRRVIDGFETLYNIATLINGAYKGYKGIKEARRAVIAQAQRGVTKAGQELSGSMANPDFKFADLLGKRIKALRAAGNANPYEIARLEATLEVALEYGARGFNKAADGFEKAVSFLQKAKDSADVLTGFGKVPQAFGKIADAINDFTGAYSNAPGVGQTIGDGINYLGAGTDQAAGGQASGTGQQAGAPSAGAGQQATGSTGATGFTTGSASATGSTTGSAGGTGPTTGSAGATGSTTGSASATGPTTGSAGATGPTTGSADPTGPTTGSADPTGPTTGSASATGPTTGSAGATGPTTGSAGATGPTTGSASATGSTTGSASATGPTTGSAGATGQPSNGQAAGTALPGAGQTAAAGQPSPDQAAGTALPGAGQTGTGTGTGPAGAVAGQIDDHTDEIESHVDKIESHVDKIKSHVDNIKSWK